MKGDVRYPIGSYPIGNSTIGTSSPIPTLISMARRFFTVGSIVHFSQGMEGPLWVGIGAAALRRQGQSVADIAPGETARYMLGPKRD